MQNLHTHTIYCDGKNTPEEMVKYALDKGFDSLGFSGHSYMFFSAYSGISAERTEKCNEEVRALAQKYKDTIKLYLGLEYDFYSEVDLSGYDYLIGSVHYLKIGDKYVAFDRGADEVKSVINEYFAGDGLAFAKEYYKTVAELPTRGKFDIIGHFDLITKNCDKTFLFDMDSKEYLSYAFEAIDALRGKIPLFEVNTGAIARGYRKTPYPAIPLLKELKRCGFGAIISSDCHNGEYLDCAFSDARELLLSCGFTEKYVLGENGFTAEKL